MEGFLVGETGADAIRRFFTLRPRCKKKKKKCEKKAKTIAGCLLRKKKKTKQKEMEYAKV